MFEDLSCFVPRPLHLVDLKKKKKKESKLRCCRWCAESFSPWAYAALISQQTVISNTFPRLYQSVGDAKYFCVWATRSHENAPHLLTCRRPMSANEAEVMRPARGEISCWNFSRLNSSGIWRSVLLWQNSYRRPSRTVSTFLYSRQGNNDLIFTSSVHFWSTIRKKDITMTNVWKKKQCRVTKKMIKVLQCSQWSFNSDLSFMLKEWTVLIGRCWCNCRIVCQI